MKKEIYVAQSNLLTMSRFEFNKKMDEKEISIAIDTNAVPGGCFPAGEL